MGLRTRAAVALIALAWPLAGQSGDPIQRAVTYLSGAMSRWPKENGCFSCHNNGDAARALLRAEAEGYSVGRHSWRRTLTWLSQPESWGEQVSDAPSSDKKLARLQFAAALADAVGAGYVEASALRRGAEALAADQQPDGSWRIEEETSVGSPVTWGRTLATYMARSVLLEVDARRYRRHIDSASQWLLQKKASNVPEASALLMTFAEMDGDPATEKRREAISYLLATRTSDGLWGPYPKTPPEVFDSAVAALAVVRTEEFPGRKATLASVENFLLESQLDGGGWLETTRPSGNSSYAQHVSTSAWATMALIEMESGARARAGVMPR